MYSDKSIADCLIKQLSDIRLKFVALCQSIITHAVRKRNNNKKKPFKETNPESIEEVSQKYVDEFILSLSRASITHFMFTTFERLDGRLISFATKRAIRIIPMLCRDDETLKRIVERIETTLVPAGQNDRVIMQFRSFGMVGMLQWKEFFRTIAAGKLRSLSLDHCNVHDRGIAVLCECFEEASELRLLNLRGNQITEEGMQRLTRFLRNQCPNMETLCLTSNLLKDEGVKVLCNGYLSQSNVPLRSLKLDNNKITKHGAFLLASANQFNRVTDLSLSMNDIGSGGCLNFIMYPKQIADSPYVSLGLKSTQIDCVEAATLLCSGLYSLNLSANELKGEELARECLRGAHALPGLERLCLTENELGSGGVKMLSENLLKFCVNLRVLDLSKTSIQDVVPVIACLKQYNLKLSDLQLNNNPLNSASYQAIAQYAVTTPGCRKIGIYNDRIVLFQGLYAREDVFLQNSHHFAYNKNGTKIYCHVGAVLESLQIFNQEYAELYYAFALVKRQYGVDVLSAISGEAWGCWKSVSKYLVQRIILPV